MPDEAHRGAPPRRTTAGGLLSSGTLPLVTNSVGAKLRRWIVYQEAVMGVLLC